MRKPTTTIASWFGKILRFNAENEGGYFLFLGFCPKFDCDVCLSLRRINVGKGSDKEFPQHVLVPLFDICADFDRNPDEIEKADILINKLLTGKVNPDQLTDENWKSFCEEI